MKKKGILIAIIVLIVLLVLAGGAFAYIYFATDLLKTDKELFQKYAVQMGDSENGFIPSILEEYGNKKSTTAYENNGSISANTTITADTSTDSTLQELSSVLEQANAANISFSGRVDNANRKVEQNIVLNYSDTVNFPFNYKQDGDVYALQADAISPAYIAFENNNLQEFAQKLGVTDVSSIPNKIEFKEIQSLKFTDEEKTHIVEQYVMPAFDRFTDDKFSREENADGSVTYVLSVTNIELRDTAVQMLETLKNDTMLLNKINSIIQETSQMFGEDSTEQSQLTAEQIDQVITSLNEEDLKEIMFQIGITQSNGVTSRLSISQDSTTIYIDKQQSDDNITYNASITLANEDENNIAFAGATSETFSLTMSYSGLSTNTATESISLNTSVAEKYDTRYSYTNTVTFGNAVSIEGFGQDTAILNNYNAEQITPFLTQVTLMIAQSNADLMNQIGFPETMGNPMLVWFTGPSLAMNMLSVSAVGSSQSDLSSAEVETFNSTFTNYEGEQRGVNVKSLCDSVRIHNLTANSGEKVNIKIGEATATTATDNVNEPDTIKDQIDATKTYNVTLSYDASTGKICEIGVNEAGDLNSQAEQGQQAFNEAMMYEDQHMLNVEHWVNQTAANIEAQQ